MIPPHCFSSSELNHQKALGGSGGVSRFPIKSTRSLRMHHLLKPWTSFLPGTSTALELGLSLFELGPETYGVNGFTWIRGSDSLDSGAVYSLAKNPFSLSSSCHLFTTPRTLVSGFLGREKISDYFSEISAPDGSSVNKKDSDGNLSSLLLRHTPKFGG